MAERKPFLLRVDPALLTALQRWADDDLRSLNAQIEFLLRQSLKKAGRSVGKEGGPGSDGEGESGDGAARGRKKASD